MEISSLNDTARQGLGFGLGVLIQSSITLIVGLVVAAVVRRRGVELQSVIYKSAICSVAGMLCVSLVFGHIIRPVWQITVPQPANTATTRAPIQAGMPRAAFLNKTVAYQMPKMSETYRRQIATQVNQAQAIKPMRIDLSNIYAICGLIWLTGTSCVWLWLLIGSVSLIRLYKKSSPVADLQLVEFVCTLSSRYGIVTPELRCHRSVKAPYVAKLNRPVILLPEDYMGHFSPREIRMALVHELAHVRQNDFEWNLAILAICGLLWPQALLWITQRKWRQKIEERCDEWVVSEFTSVSDYARCLLDVAERQSGFSIAPATGIGMVYVKSSLGMRIRRLLDNTHHRIATLSPLTKSSVGAAAVLVALLAACLISTNGANGAIEHVAKAPKQFTAAVAQLSKPKEISPLEKQKIAIERNRTMLSHQITLARLAKKALPSAVTLAAALTNPFGVTLPASADTTQAMAPTTTTTVTATSPVPAKPQAMNGPTIQKVPSTNPNVTWSLTAPNITFTPTPGTAVVPSNPPAITYYYDTTPGAVSTQKDGQDLDYYVQTIPVQARKVGTNGETLVSVNADDIPIRAALAQIFATSPASYVVKDDVTGTVTAHLHDVPFTMAIQSILEASSKQVTYQVKSDSADPDGKPSEANQIYVFRSATGRAETLDGTGSSLTLPSNKSVDGPKNMDIPVTLNYDNVKLSDVIASLCKAGSLQYSLPEDVGNEKISVNMFDVRLGAAISNVLKLSKLPLTWTLTDTILYVQTKGAIDRVGSARTQSVPS